MKRIVVFLLIAGVFLAVSAAKAGGAGYALDWWTIDGGGGSLSAGDYQLTGAIGQPDAAQPLTAGDYELAGGFWPGFPRLNIRLFLPLIKNP